MAGKKALKLALGLWLLCWGLAWAQDSREQAPFLFPKKGRAKPRTTLVNAGDEMIFTQVVDDAPGMGEYRWYNQDFGWTHTFDVPNACVAWAKLDITAWDVDYDAPDGETDRLSVNGQDLGTLYGYDWLWYTTSFTLPASLVLAGPLNLWLDIDSTHTQYFWATTIGASTLHVGYKSRDKKLLTISPQPPIIPRNSQVVDGRVLTRSVLDLQLVERNEACAEEPVARKSLHLQSDRPSQDQITQPRPTNGQGRAQGEVETRDQLTNSGTSTITAAYPDV
jgi:hypothetical protein